MELDEMTLRDGLKFICGTWEADYVVNAFSNDLAHIPASEFKSKDGRDFTAIRYEFREDHTLTACSGLENAEDGTWEQTGYCEYQCHLSSFDALPEGPFRANAGKLNIVDGHLCFAIGFLSVAMKKTAEGTVTEPAKPEDAEPSAEDLSLCAIVGRYRIAKAMAVVDGNFGKFTREEAFADLQKRIDAGEADPHDMRELGFTFDCLIEFTADHQVITWYQLPPDLTEEQIKAAVEEGEIGEVRDGYFVGETTEWKAVGGKYYYDTHQTRIVMGEEQSSWDEIAPDADGMLPYADGMILLQKID